MHQTLPMKKTLLIIFAFTFSAITSELKAGFGEFVSYHATIHTAILNNYQYGVSTSPNKLHIGLGVGGSASINSSFNLMYGLAYMKISPNNNNSDYSFCPDASCFPVVSSHQLFVPVGVEYYSNSDRSPFQSYFTISLVPAFSFSQESTITSYDKFNIEGETYTEKNNGFKFQDLHFQIAVNNEFSLDQNYKIYVEPSLSHTVLFKSEDTVNPDYMISIKIGFKFRGEGKK